MKKWFIAFLAVIACNFENKKLEQPKVSTLKNGPTIEQLYDSMEVDSIKYRTKIDSLLFFSSSDSTMVKYLDQCYWPYHVRRIKIKPVYNKRGFSTTEADVKIRWQFERKSVDCGDMETKLAEYNEVTFLDSTCTHCFLIKLDPFDCPIQYITVDRQGDLIFTESYARGGMLGLTRLKKKYHLDYLDEKEIGALLDSLSSVPAQNNEIGLDGMSIYIGFTAKRKVFEIGRWQHPQEMAELWRFIERKLGIKLPQCNIYNH